MATLLGKKIHEARKKAGLTLDKLAELTDSSKSYIWALENNDDVNPTAEKLSKLAKQLNVTLEFLLDSEKDQPSELDAKNVFFRRVENLTQPQKVALMAVLDALESDSSAAK